MTKKEFMDSLAWVDGTPTKSQYRDFGDAPIAIKVAKEIDGEEFLIMGNINLNGGWCNCCSGEPGPEDIIAHAYLYKEEKCQ